jgi:hypothetical protein
LRPAAFAPRSARVTSSCRNRAGGRAITSAPGQLSPRIACCGLSYRGRPSERFSFRRLLPNILPMTAASCMDGPRLASALAVRRLRVLGAVMYTACGCSRCMAAGPDEDREARAPIIPTWSRPR